MAAAQDQTYWPPYLLNNNEKMPAVGLGTFKIRMEADVIRAIDEALACGYRLFDTAGMYSNEKHLKKAFEMLLPKYELEREDIFLTSKLSPMEMTSDKAVKKAFKKTITNLNVEYLDMYLIEFPGVTNLLPSSPKNKLYRHRAWSALTNLHDNGLINSIGVANFTIEHIESLMTVSHDVIPTVNQVEWHPYYKDEELYKYCHKNGIVVQGYSPLGGYKSCGALLNDPAVKSIASDLEVTEAQVLLVWSLQNDIPTLVKSVSPERIRSNFQLEFKLSNAQLNILNNLNIDKKYGCNPKLYR